MMHRGDIILATGVFGSVGVVLATWAIWNKADSQTAAAWVQGIGTISAILGSAWIARWQFAQQDKRSDEQRKLQARVLAYLLIPRIIPLQNQCRTIALIRDQFKFGLSLFGNLPVEEIVERLTITATLPGKFKHQLQCFDALTAMSVAQIYGGIADYNRFVREGVPKLPNVLSPGAEQYHSAITQKFANLESAIDMAFKRLALYHSNADI